MNLKVLRHLSPMMVFANTLFANPYLLMQEVTYDNIPPEPVATVVATMHATLVGQMSLNIQFVGDLTEIKQIDIRQTAGTIPPSSDCLDGDLIQSFNTFSNSILDVNGTPGQTYTYRACVYDLDQNLESSVTATAMMRPNPPADLASLTGNTHTSVGYGTVSLTYPTDTSAYSSVQIRMIAGSTPPSADCQTGTIMATYDSNFTPTSFNFTGTAGAYYSFRACIYGQYDDFTAGSTVTVRTKPNPPPNIASISAYEGASPGYGTVYVNFPADTSLYSRVEIRMVAGTGAPSSACNSGTIVRTFTSYSNTSFSFTGTAGSYYAFRACIYGNYSDYTAGSTTYTRTKPSGPVFSYVSGDYNPCSGKRQATTSDVSANSAAACAAIGSYFIVRLAGGHSLSGSSYGCTINYNDTRGMGETLCVTP